MQRHYPFEKRKFEFGGDYDESLFNPKTQYQEQEKGYEADLRMLNELIMPIPWLHSWTLEELLTYKIPYIARTTAEKIKNYAGVVYARELYFDNFSPSAQGFPSAAFSDAIIKGYGSYQNFRDEFEDYAEGAYGSGWVWITVDQSGDVRIAETRNNEIPPLTTYTPLVAFNTWEYEYYLKFKNEFNKYLNSWFDAINWNKVNDRLDAALK